MFAMSDLPPWKPGEGMYVFGADGTSYASVYPPMNKERELWLGECFQSYAKVRLSDVQAAGLIDENIAGLSD